MTIQTLKTESGEELVVMSRRDYDALLARLDDEDAEDRMTLLIAAEARGEEPLPADVSSAVLGGDSLLKALRKWRGLTQAELSEKSGVNQGFLSQIESGVKAGAAETMAKLEAALNVPKGWLG